MFGKKCHHLWHPIGYRYEPWWAFEWRQYMYCPKCHKTKRFRSDKIRLEQEKQDILDRYGN